ncbi:MAG: hypothetical protein ABIL40_02305 [candidate division WOR-3 bacterium]
MRSFIKFLIMLPFFGTVDYAGQTAFPDNIEPLYGNAAGLDLMSDVPWVVNKDEIIPFFFTHPVDLDLTNDSIHRQKTQSEASRVTLGKIALESVGAAAGGTLGGFICSIIVGPVEFWQGAATFGGITVGLAGGTTIVGNLVMEPNGSFKNSLIGSCIGTGLGAGVFVLTSLAYLGWEPGMEADWTTAYCGLSLAVLLPISGAVVGYNTKGFSCCLTSIRDADPNTVSQAFISSVNVSFRVQIIAMEF